MKLVSVISVVFLCLGSLVKGQSGGIAGKILSDNAPVLYGTVVIAGTPHGVVTDSSGNYQFVNLTPGAYKLKFNAGGYMPLTKTIIVKENEITIENILLNKKADQLDEVVVTGTLKEVKRIESPVPVEVYSPAFFKKNPTPSIFDALQNVNGVRPQLNCNVCNTGDIHINGLEGPYTMVLIDGMPIVSSLATVYGLSGIPNSIVERIEIVKGPASSLYGSEAVGGLINIITKTPQSAPVVAADVMATSWQEYNADLGFKLNAGKNIAMLTGINYFKYGNIIDENNDNFTDVTLQDRFSIFQKLNLYRKDNKLFNIAARYFTEDRWGGDVRWTKAFRGGDSIYGESIYTRRWEFLSNYQLPTKEKFLLNFSYNDHDQDSRYGKTIYDAKQRIAFTQLTWDKKMNQHDLLAGVALRYTFYDDNTTATANNYVNAPQRSWLPGVFVQDEIALATNHKLLAGLRYDHHSKHGNIFTPRIAYKWSINPNNIFRINAGTGFRVVNLFTEDHAALTGARFVEIKNELKPEKSYNVNLNYIKKLYANNGMFAGIELTGWYTYFNNRIIADYNTDPNKIVYDNINGFAESKGMSLNLDVLWSSGLKILAGATYMEVTSTNNGIKAQQLLTEKFTGTWAISYKIKKLNLGVDYTGNIYGPMQLPLLGKLDPRMANSPTWSIQNIQVLYSGFKKFEVYGGIKNLLNFTPAKNNPFIIARTNDPFDKNVQFDANGQVVATPSNPYALSFDPTYVFAPNQGLRGFIGVRYTLK